MLRGRLNITVLPVWVFMLMRITVSVRTPVRPSPPSPPSSSTLTRSVPAQGFSLVRPSGVVALSVSSKTVDTRSAWAIALRAAVTTG